MALDGNTYVQYDSIKGENMQSQITPFSIMGSENTAVDENGESKPLGYTVAWSLPGGIMNKGLTDRQGAWGFIRGMAIQGNQPYSDKDFCEFLFSEYGYQFDEECNLVNENQTMDLRNTINTLVAAYFRRVQMNSSEESEEYNWNRMNDYYGTCIEW